MESFYINQNMVLQKDMLTGSQKCVRQKNNA